MTKGAWGRGEGGKRTMGTGGDEQRGKTRGLKPKKNGAKARRGQEKSIKRVRAGADCVVGIIGVQKVRKGGS